MNGSPPILSDPHAAPGYIARALIRWFMRPAVVTAVQPLSDAFRLIELRSDSFRNAAWSPGQKLQIQVGTGLTARTYTPIDRNAAGSALRILAFCHSPGTLGGRWILACAPGDICHVFGPRESLKIPVSDAPLVVLGDETAFGLAASLTRTTTHGPHCFFEVESTSCAASVLSALGVHHAEFVQRLPDDSHLVSSNLFLDACTERNPLFVLVGKSASIQYWRRRLRSRQISARQILVRPYWVPGRTGLD